MSVSNLTNGCKKAIHLTELEVLDLQYACLGRIPVINDLIRATRDLEDKAVLQERLKRVQDLLGRLRAL